MTFHEGGQFDGGRVRKGSGGSGGKMALGGGLGTIVVVLLALFLGNGNVDLGTLLDGLGDDTQTGSATQTDSWIEACTAEQANTDPECRLNATVQALDAYWVKALPKQSKVSYVEPQVVSFSGKVRTGCGSADSSIGPFYCPSDQTVYIDLTFFDELRDEYGASKGNLPEEYVVAHEFGHHIQTLTNMWAKADDSKKGATSDAVRMELMADCLAGMWAGNAATTVDPDTGVPFLNKITDKELAAALSAAQAIGDDRLQQKYQGKVNPDSFTHGTSAQRQKWFKVGYEGGTMAKCNTLKAAKL